MQTDAPIISVHVPKCAGTSFQLWLTQAYGTEDTFLDYDDLPMDPSSPTNMDPEGFRDKFISQTYPGIARHRVIHGHFLANKYDFLGDQAFRITFLRHPIERAISNYFFWRKQPRSQNRLHNYMQDNQLSWQEFVRLPIIRYLYSKVFFRDFDMNRFQFIGDASHPVEETSRLGRILGFSHALPHINQTMGDYPVAAKEILSSESNMAMLRDLFSDDIRFYETHVGR